MRTVKSYCRICSGACGMELDLDGNRIVRIRGDHDHAMTRGYACIKGLQAAHIHEGPNRLLHPLKRRDDGSFEQIPLEQALDEIAAKVQHLIERDSPRAIAAFRGTQNYYNSAAYPLLQPWLAALGSPNFFSTATIDQFSKFVTANRMGSWEAGLHTIETSDVWCAVGFNPLVSLQAGMGFPTLNPTLRMRELKARGL